MGLARNDFLLSFLYENFLYFFHLSWTLREKSISYSLFPIYHILQTEIIKGKIIYFWLSKLSARLTRSRDSKFILSQDDCTNGINRVNNQVSVHTGCLEMHLGWQMFTLSYIALIYPLMEAEGGGPYHINKGRGCYSILLHGSFPSLGKT